MKQVYSLKVLVAIGIITLAYSASYAQCSAFVKKKCMPKIQPFQQNGQINSSSMTSGQKTAMNLTFYSGQDYRILVCGQPQLGELTFKVFDSNRKLVFDSQKNNYPDFWDFKVKKTQQLIVEVQVPESESTSSVLPTGCVSIMVGFKKA